MKRIYHRYEKWECYHHGMYVERSKEDRPYYIEKASELLKDTKKLRHYMERVAKEWFYSTQNHMTCRTANRQAYLGQCACSLAHNCGESETREAWKHLTEEERDAANAVADDVIKLWEGWHEDYVKEKSRNERLRSSEKEDRVDIR